MRGSFSLIIAGLAVSKNIYAQSTNQQSTNNAKEQEEEFLNTYCKTKGKTVIPSGSEAEARKYYADLANLIGFEINDPPAGKQGQTTKLDDVVTYLGYTGYTPKGTASTASSLTSQEIQDAPPPELMDITKLSRRLGGLQLSVGDVLVVRFFAPKISNVSGPKVTEAGWRKLLRLRAQPGSKAATRGIDYGFVLFNFFAPIGKGDPFSGNDSQNTQGVPWNAFNGNVVTGM